MVSQQKKEKGKDGPTSLVTKKMQIKIYIYMVSINFENVYITCIGKNLEKQALNMLILLWVETGFKYAYITLSSSSSLEEQLDKL